MTGQTAEPGMIALGRDQKRPPTADDHQHLAYGIQPGVRFACILDGAGGCNDLCPDELKEWSPGQGVLWIHLERDDPAAQDWLRHRCGVDPLIVEALLADESRPRVEDFDDALLIVLRGVNHNEKDMPVDLVPVHLWITKDLLISLRDKDHALVALRDLRQALVNNHGPRTIGALFAQIAEKLVQNLEPLVDELEERVETLDEAIGDRPMGEARQTLSAIRRQSSKLRRYIAPQREALSRLQLEEPSWLGKREKIYLREVTDRVIRYIESLDSVRDRATILHEDLTSLVSEQINKNSHRLTAVAAVLLPPSVVAGIFGMNLGGLPGNQDPYGFLYACLVMLLMIPIEYLVLKRVGWI